MIIKNLSKIKIHFFSYITIIIALITGNIRNYIFYIIILIVHELGHLLPSILFNWKINKIIILPFGGLIIYDNKINTKLKEQLIVTIMGPLFQIIFFLIINNKFTLSENIIIYNYTLLLFNLLPIYPLDGYKLTYILLNYILPFKITHKSTLILSFIIIIIILLTIKFDLLIYLILILLSFKTYIELKNHKLIFNKFLYERYTYKLNLKKLKYIKNINSLYLNKRNIIKHQKTYITERNYLSKMFDKHNNL